MGHLFILSGELISILIIIGGFKFRKKKSSVYCLVMAGIKCLCTPFGIVLGVFSPITLTKEAFEKCNEIFMKGQRSRILPPQGDEASQTTLTKSKNRQTEESPT